MNEDNRAEYSINTMPENLNTFYLRTMSKVSRRTLISELGVLAGGKLTEMEGNLNNYWANKWNDYGGLDISDFKDAKLAGKFEISEFSNSGQNEVFPRLKVNWCNGVKPNKTSSYIITVDGKIAKIGALRKGVKGNSFAQYLSGVSGSPSRRSCGVYTFISAMLKGGKKVEVYHVTMDGVIDAIIPTIAGNVNGTIHFASSDIEKANLKEYKDRNGDKAPYLNFKERNATFPKEFDVLYDLINKRILATKKYTE